MSEPSSWPLTTESFRIRITPTLVANFEKNQLTSSCYPTSVGYYPKALHHSMSRNMPDDYILIYCVDGRGYLEQKDSLTRVSKGDLLVLPPSVYHRYYADEADPWTIYWCHFRGDKASEYYQQAYCHLKSSVIKNHDLKVLSIFEEMIALAASVRDGVDALHLVNSWVYLLSLIAYNQKRSIEEPHDEILNVQAYMRANLAKRLTLSELAGMCGVSKYHFNRKYRDLVGVSPLNHFQYFKMEYACLQLEQTNLSISMIANSVGYEDPLYFSRSFKKRYHVSPSLYRKKFLVEKLE